MQEEFLIIFIHMIHGLDDAPLIGDINGNSVYNYILENLIQTLTKTAMMMVYWMEMNKHSSYRSQ